MTPSQALPILHALADGIDPHTGEIFPAGSPYQQADMVRALMAAVAALESAAERAAKKDELPVQAGKPWSDEEDAHLREGFAARTAAADLSETHGRTTGAIRSRLARLGQWRHQFVDDATDDHGRNWG